MEDFAFPILFKSPPECLLGGDRPTIGYFSEPYEASKQGAAQSILANRNVLKPRLDLNQFKCEAVIDWLEIRLPTLGRHQAVNIQRRAAKTLAATGSTSTVRVTDPERNWKHIGQDFLVRIQDPKPVELARLLHELGKFSAFRCENLKDLELSGIEVSIDFYPQTKLLKEEFEAELLRWRMVEVLRRHIRPDDALAEVDGGKPRTFDPIDNAIFLVEGEPRHLEFDLCLLRQRLEPSERAFTETHRSAHRFQNIDTTFYVGKKDTDIMLRVMDKTTDRRDPSRGTVRDLEMSERRARIEVELKATGDLVGGNAAVGLEKLGDLYGYRFKSLRKMLFEFFLPTTDSTGDVPVAGILLKGREAEIFQRSGVYGLDRFHRAVSEFDQKAYRRRELSEKPPKLRRKGRLMSYRDLNGRAARALDRLSHTWDSQSLLTDFDERQRGDTEAAA